MPEAQVKAPPSILDPDWMPIDQGDWKIEIKPLDDGANPRMIVRLNISAKSPFYAVLEPAGAPPFAVCVVQAHPDIVALGVIEKLKIMVHQIQTKFNIAAKLSQGVRGVDLKSLPPLTNGRKQ